MRCEVNIDGGPLVASLYYFTLHRLQIVVLANLDDHVCTVTLLEHVPEVFRDHEDVLLVDEIKLVVMNRVIVNTFISAMCVHAVSERFVSYRTRVRALIGDKLSPDVDPGGRDQAVGEPAPDCNDSLVVLVVGVQG